MSGPTFDHASSVARVGDTVEISGAVPGPAGSAAMDLGHGVRIEVDYAEPDVMVACTLPARGATDPDVAAVVDELLGEEVGAQVRAFVASGADHAPLVPEARWVGYEGPPVERVVGEVVCIADRVDDPRRPLVERALAGLDLAEFADRCGAVPRFAAAALAAAGRAEGLLGECIDELADRAAADPRIADRLRTVHARRIPGSLQTILEERIRFDAAATELLDAAESLASMPPEFPPARAAEPVVMSRTVHFDRAPEPQPRPEVVHRIRGVWVIECPAADRARTERWVRVLDVDLTVVAAAPLRRATGPDGPVDRAEVLVPAHCTPAHTRIEVMTNPFPAGPVGLDALAGAVGAGRRAVDLEATANHSIAARQWAQCAAAWTDLGDTARADLARARAERPTRRSRLRVLGDLPLCDAVAGPLA